MNLEEIVKSLNIDFILKVDLENFNLKKPIEEILLSEKEKELRESIEIPDDLVQLIRDKIESFDLNENTKKLLFLYLIIVYLAAYLETNNKEVSRTVTETYLSLDKEYLLGKIKVLR